MFPSLDQTLSPTSEMLLTAAVKSFLFNMQLFSLFLPLLFSLIKQKVFSFVVNTG